jgi:hypothetical protein
MILGQIAVLHANTQVGNEERSNKTAFRGGFPKYTPRLHEKNQVQDLL